MFQVFTPTVTTNNGNTYRSCIYFNALAILLSFMVNPVKLVKLKLNWFNVTK